MKDTQDVNIKFEKPPNWELINKNFKLNDRVYFTYADTIYNPNLLPLPEEIIEHEKVHMKQQGYTVEGADEWWAKYIADPQFRFEQEVEAYKKQYQVFCKKVKDRNKRVKYLLNISSIAASELYGNCCSVSSAMERIK